MSAEEEESGGNRDSSLAWRKGSTVHSGKAPGFSVQNIKDFEKFTEGMDDLGSSEEGVSRYMSISTVRFEKS